MFDDNIEEGRPGSYGSGTDSLSLKTSCSVYLGTQKRGNVKFRDNINSVKRNMEIGDESLIRVVFDSMIKVYYEHMFVFKNDKFKAEKLFPELTLSELNKKFGIKFPMSKQFENHFFHFAFVELMPNPTKN